MDAKRQDDPSACMDWRDTILESIADGVFTVNQDWRITYFNRSAEEITGIERQQAIGRYCWEVFHSDVCEKGCCLRQSLKTGEAIVHQAAHIIAQDGQRIPISISTAVLRDQSGALVGGVETFRSLADVESLRKELTQRYTFADIVSKNKTILELLDILPQVALSDATVLIQGESGTGKELFARAVHNLSRRREGPLVTVNCAALPDNLLESELFGHVAGAFTDARQDRQGRFQKANNGTLFLDEIGDISPALQVRLLRVLQEKTVEPLGSNRVEKIDVRVITATNKNLADLVSAGTFREDLFYRIHVVTLEIPPLRSRREDIPLLVEHFIDRFNRLRGKEVSHLAPTTLATLMEHDFPGNVRELINAIEHAFVLCPGGVILPEHLPAHLRPTTPIQPVPEQKSNTLEAVEARLLLDALQRNHFNRSAAARELGIHKTTLWRKMKKLGIKEKE